jgi:hypothetical protein
MEKLKWKMLAEVYGRMEAEMIKSLLEAEGIPVELFQEGIGHHVFPVTVDGLGKVQVFVPNKKITEAREWLHSYETGIEANDQATQSAKRKKSASE